MKTRLLLVSTAFVALCFGASTAYADSSLRLYGLSDVIPFNTLHTHLSRKLSLSPHQVSKQSEIKVAQVCWIMDTGECAGLDFVSSDIDEPSGNKPIDYIPKDDTDCIKEGYTLTSCPTGYEPNKYCLYDSRYFAECVPSCPDDYKKCEEPYYGVGEECNGMYKECQCDECEGYDYKEDDIPTGYIKDGEPCNSCNGPRYKIKPNPCDGFLDCGDMGCESGSETCQSGDKILCTNCKPCPNKCDLATCPANALCDKEDCSGKYCFEKCNDGYEWDEATQSCKSACVIGCTDSYCPSDFTCIQDPCSGKYCKIGCSSTSQWFSEETKQCCSTSYKYDESNCPSSSNGHCSSTCGEKYSDCLALPTGNSYQYLGTTYAKVTKHEYANGGRAIGTNVEGCPGRKEFLISEYADGNLIIDYINDSNLEGNCIDMGGTDWCECVMNADDACYELRNQLLNAGDGGVVNVNQDMNCGNLTMIIRHKYVTLNGNNHTLSFTKGTDWGGNIFSAYQQYYNSALYQTIKNLNLDIKYINDGNSKISACSISRGKAYIFSAKNYLMPYKLYNVNLSVAPHYTMRNDDIYTGEVVVMDKLNTNHITNVSVADNATLNILSKNPVGTAEIDIGNNSTININYTYPENYEFNVLGENSVINLCGNNVPSTIYFKNTNNCKKITINTVKDVKISSLASECYEKNVNPNACDGINF